MTTGLILGTESGQEKVFKLVEAAGFSLIQSPERSACRNHNLIDKLRVQVHPPSYLYNVKNVVTELEFDDGSDRFPNHPEALQALRDLYSTIPDLVYLKNEEEFYRGKESACVEELLKFLDRFRI